MKSFKFNFSNSTDLYLIREERSFYFFIGFIDKEPKKIIRRLNIKNINICHYCKYNNNINIHNKYFKDLCSELISEFYILIEKIKINELNLFKYIVKDSRDKDIKFYNSIDCYNLYKYYDINKCKERTLLFIKRTEEDKKTNNYFIDISNIKVKKGFVEYSFNNFLEFILLLNNNNYSINQTILNYFFEVEGLFFKENIDFFSYTKFKINDNFEQEIYLNSLLNKIKEKLKNLIIKINNELNKINGKEKDCCFFIKKYLRTNCLVGEQLQKDLKSNNINFDVKKYLNLKPDLLKLLENKIKIDKNFDEIDNSIYLNCDTIFLKNTIYNYGIFIEPIFETYYLFFHNEEKKFIPFLLGNVSLDGEICFGNIYQSFGIDEKIQNEDLNNQTKVFNLNEILQNYLNSIFFLENGGFDILLEENIKTYPLYNKFLNPKLDIKQSNDLIYLESNYIIEIKKVKQIKLVYINNKLNFEKTLINNKIPLSNFNSIKELK